MAYTATLTTQIHTHCHSHSPLLLTASPLNFGLTFGTETVLPKQLKFPAYSTKSGQRSEVSRESNNISQTTISPLEEHTPTSITKRNANFQQDNPSQHDAGLPARWSRPTTHRCDWVGRNTHNNAASKE